MRFFLRFLTTKSLQKMLEFDELILICSQGGGVMNTEIIELKQRMVLELLEEELKTKSLIKKAILIKLYLMLSR
jgi:hypothetical protein